MDIYTSMPTRAKKFTNLADLDQFIHSCVLDDSGIEKRYLTVGSVRRMTMYFDRLESQLKRIASSSCSIFVEHGRGIDLTTDGHFLWTVLRDAEAEAASALCEGRRLNPWLTIGLHLARKWG